MKEYQSTLVIALLAGILSSVAPNKLVTAMAAILGTIYAAISLYELLNEKQ